MARVKSAKPSRTQPMFPFRTVVMGVFAPSLVFGIAVGVCLPLIPLYAIRLGADLATAGFVSALLPIGKIIADVPAGAVAARIGDRRAMTMAALLGLAALGGAAGATSLWMLQVAVLSLGVATAVFHLARHAYLTEITPAGRRARMLSTLGGMHRLGYFIGPFLGAAVIIGSSIRPAFWLATGCAGLSLVILLAVSDKTSVTDEAGSPPTTGALGGTGRPIGGVFTVMRSYRRLFLTLGSATLLVGAVRGARQTVLPLWGQFQGFDPEVISLIFGLSGALDMLLFYPAGKVMDHYGRLWIGIPSMLLMGLALALLPLADTVATVAVVAALLGLGNGVGAGIIMTLGSDVAPSGQRSPFLGVWRLFQDTGDAAGPLIISAATALGSLAAGIWVVSVVSCGASAALGRWVPKYSDHANRSTRRRVGIG